MNIDWINWVQLRTYLGSDTASFAGCGWSQERDDAMCPPQSCSDKSLSACQVVTRPKASWKIPKDSDNSGSFMGPSSSIMILNRSSVLHSMPPQKQRICRQADSQEASFHVLNNWAGRGKGENHPRISNHKMSVGCVQKPFNPHRGGCTALNPRVSRGRIPNLLPVKNHLCFFDSPYPYSYWSSPLYSHCHWLHTDIHIYI